MGKNGCRDSSLHWDDRSKLFKDYKYLQKLYEIFY